MRQAIYPSTLALLLLMLVALLAPLAHAQESPSTTNTNTSANANTSTQETAPDSSSNDPLKAELKEITKLPPQERIAKLRAFIEAHPVSALKPRAQELIVSAYAAIGEERLRAGDEAAGIEQFRQAIAESSASMSERLFADVLSRIPLNLYLRNERTAAFELARLIEAKIKDNPARLLTLAGFYLNIEEGDEAARLAEAVVKLAPEMPEAYQALGAARYISLRLDDSITAYSRAVELDRKSARSRRSLADLRRATGKPEQALTLYRELLQTEAGDKLARTGVVLSLFELGRREEAERELEAALKDDPSNFSLLTGAAYWYTAHGDSARALELAQRAVAAEPRYTWAHIALARALVAQKRPLEAEQVLRFARQYGRFPTLDYELASALAASGLYDEAATELARTFTLKGEQIETMLAGRTSARAANFIELLAPERRAGIFQPTPADSEENARLLKNLLAFRSALSPTGGRAAIKEESAVTAARQLATGPDPMRLYRQLYAASRLIEQRVGWQTAIDLSDEAKGSLEEALDAPTATIAVLADELLDARQRAINRGGSLAVPDVPRNVLSAIIRGRIEDLAGWALYGQNKTADALVRLNRAVSVLPENSLYWRTAQWHLGTVYNANGKQQEALAAYLRSYDRNAPDPIRRAVIEGLYRKVKGSLNGLEAALGAAQAPATTAQQAPAVPPAMTATTPSSESSAAIPRTNDTTPPPSQPPTPTVAEQQAPTEAATVANSGREQPTGTPLAAANVPPSQPPAEPATRTPSGSDSAGQNRRTTGTAADANQCIFSVGTEPLTLHSSGGSVIIPVSYNGAGGAASLTATTPDWADIVIFPEPKTNIESGVFNYSITSVSKRTGSFTVNFKSPCGTKSITVIVK